jgi:hypothetical protein
MIRKFLGALVCVAILAGQASAGLVFDDLVNVNLSNFGGSDILGADSLEFGSSSLNNAKARFAFNGTDTNGDGFFTNGDVGRLVGHGQVTDIGGTSVTGISAVLRNVDTVLLGAANVFAPGSLLGGTGLLDIYVNNGAFSLTDAGSSMTGTLVATFAITEGNSTVAVGNSPFVNNEKLSTTSFTAELVFNLNNFFTTAGGAPLVNGLKLFTNIETTDRIVLVGNQSLKGIQGSNLGASRDYSGGSILNIGSGFAPPSGNNQNIATLFDVVTSVDGNAAFAVVPEPTSMLIFAGIAGVGAVGMRRRKK